MALPIAWRFPSPCDWENVFPIIQKNTGIVNRKICNTSFAMSEDHDSMIRRPATATIGRERKTLPRRLTGMFAEASHLSSAEIG